MADLTKILNGPWTPQEKRLDPPEVQLRDAMAASGIEAPDTIHMDGKIHRFSTSGKRGDDSGWYVAYGEGVPAGRFGCWRQGIEQTWRADMGRELSPAEHMAQTRRLAEAKALREAEQAKRRELAADTVQAIWDNGAAASPDHPYLARKMIQPHGARVTGDGRLMIPLYSAAGELVSLEYIGADGGKRYHPGGQTKDCFQIIGDPSGDGALYIAEGFADAATIHEATGQPCAVAYNASNLPGVAQAMRDLFGSRELVIVADHDESGVGQKAAAEAAQRTGARVVMPPIMGMDANDYALAGHDLLALLQPPQDDWLISADDFSRQPAPISWIIKHWLQRDALMMIHGPSGGGKTFAVLDMVLRVAAGGAIGEWFGHRVTAGRVLYLAGEGHHGLRGRIAAWKQRHGVGKLDMWLSRAGCDLNTPEGFQRVVEATRATLPDNPDIIVVDTLHRFLNGDENSAQDAKTMLDACGALQREFKGATVILVHHTGVSDEAQHRARGSSAWRGALDVEISVVPGKDDKPMQMVQRKSKDAELAADLWMELESVAIEGWLDEDDEQVTSAVIAPAEAPAEPERKKGDSTLQRHVKTFENAWWKSGTESRDGLPYVSRSAMEQYLEEGMGLSAPSIKQYMKPSASGKLICDLLVSGLIEPFEHGWRMTAGEHSGSLMIAKNDLEKPA